MTSNKYCCNRFEEACELRVGNEGDKVTISSEEDDWIIGVLETPIKFCPWCGKRLVNVD